MSKKMLQSLNGNNNGIFKKWLDTLNGDPQIAWYPSAGEDFTTIATLKKEFEEYATTPGPDGEMFTSVAAPDLFLLTDYFPWSSSTLFDSLTLVDKENIKITITEIEELPSLHSKLNRILVNFPKPSVVFNRVLFMHLKIKTKNNEEFTCPVLYAFNVNENFFKEVILPNEGKISHIIHYCYGGGCGGGGHACGAWLPHIFKFVNCRIYIHTSHNINCYREGDKFFLRNMCPQFANVDTEHILYKYVHPEYNYITEFTYVDEATIKNQINLVFQLDPIEKYTLMRGTNTIISTATANSQLKEKKKELDCDKSIIEINNQRNFSEYKIIGTDLLSKYQMIYDLKKKKVSFNKNPEKISGIKIPFTPIQGKVTIQVNINGKLRKMILDSSSKDSYLIEEFSQNIQREILDVYEGEIDYESYYFLNLIVGDDKLRIKFEDNIAYQESSITEVECDGVLGYELFENFIIAIDYQKLEITLKPH